MRRILETGVGLGQDGTARRDLKITAAAVEEMRAAFRLFAPYEGIPKVSIFGSARTQSHDPLWELAAGTARALAEQGWLVVTGAGPGIMEAAATGAGAERSTRGLDSGSRSKKNRTHLSPSTGDRSP